MNKQLAAVLIAIGGLALLAPVAKAQSPGDGNLILGFQNPSGATGSDQTVLVSLGQASTYRDATGDMLNITNIGSLLTSTFGANWWETGTLYMGAFSAWSNSSNISNNLLRSDPVNTNYISESRGGVGTVGSANSVGWSGKQSSALQSAAGDMLATEGHMTSGTCAVSTTTSTFDDYNPFLVGTQLGTAYDIYGGGTEFQFATNAFGSFGAAGSVEGALDLYRLQSKSTVAAQYGFGQTALNGATEYQGSLAIDQSGNVSFINAVPEPSSIAFLGMSGLLGMFARRRRS